MPRNKQNALDAYIGARLRLRRLLLDMSQETLAAKLSITFQQVQNMKKGSIAFRQVVYLNYPKPLMCLCSIFMMALTSPTVCQLMDLKKMRA